jgi:hypothetical protein
MKRILKYDGDAVAGVVAAFAAILLHFLHIVESEVLLANHGHLDRQVVMIMSEKSVNRFFVGRCPIECRRFPLCIEWAERNSPQS